MFRHVLKSESKLIGRRSGILLCHNERISANFTAKTSWTCSKHYSKTTDNRSQQLQERRQKPQNVANKKQSTAGNFSLPSSFFSQDAPELGNQYDQDAPLRRYLQRAVPRDVLGQFEPDLQRFGARVPRELQELHRECETNPPQLIQYNSWGQRVDQIVTCPAWKRMHDISAEEGMMAIAYERNFGPWSRVYQIVKNYLFAGSSGLYSCPLAMTDGAAKILEPLSESNVRFKKAFDRLTTRDAENFWTSGQWMTERRGGSDVANGTETIAVQQGDSGDYRLFGYKGTQGLSLFYLETRGDDGKLNNIEIVKLKNKLGTRQLPTAELLLNGTVATLASPPGRGVAAISTMLVLTRIHNAISAVSSMRRMVHLARDYATKRSAFGKLLQDHPLHVRVLASMELETRGSLMFLLEVAHLLGLEECQEATEDQKLLLRILTPIIKLFTAKQAVAVASEGVESFGGQGFIEDTGLPGILRDAQVLPIWEGTTNILSLDVLRSITKSQGSALQALMADCLGRLGPENSSQLTDERRHVAENIKELAKFPLEHHAVLETAARDFALSLARTYIGSLLIEQATATKDVADTIAARRWCSQGMMLLREPLNYSPKFNSEDKLMLMDGYQESE